MPSSCCPRAALTALQSPAKPAPSTRMRSISCLPRLRHATFSQTLALVQHAVHAASGAVTDDPYPRDGPAFVPEPTRPVPLKAPMTDRERRPLWALRPSFGRTSRPHQPLRPHLLVHEFRHRHRLYRAQEQPIDRKCGSGRSKFRCVSRCRPDALELNPSQFDPQETWSGTASDPHVANLKHDRRARKEIRRGESG